jgi:hypothetical protein
MCVYDVVKKAQPMKIEEGKFYRTRDGGYVAGPMTRRSDSTNYPWTTPSIFRSENPNIAEDQKVGRFVWTTTGLWDTYSRSSPSDLTEEVRDPRPKKKVGEVVYIGPDNKLLEEKEDMSNPVKPNESVLSSLTGTVKSVREKIRPYDKYIVMAAVVIAIDYFVFDGKISEKTKEIFKRLSNKFISALDKVIDKIGE